MPQNPSKSALRERPYDLISWNLEKKNISFFLIAHLHALKDRFSDKIERLRRSVTTYQSSNSFAIVSKSVL